jgi:hypothetical protein
MVLQKKKILKLTVLAFILYVLINIVLFVRNEGVIREEARKDRIIRYECEQPLCGGWADRLKGIMGAYYWALFSNRKFQLNIKHPCYFEKILLPNKIDWKMYEKNYYHYTYELYAIDDFYFRNRILKDLDIVNYKSNYQVIVIKNNLDWLLSMSKNHHLQDKLMQFGIKADELNAPYSFHSLYNNLFKLNDYLEIKYNEFRKAIANRTLICVQVRVHYYNYVI